MGVDFKVSQSGEMPGILGVVHPDLHCHRGYCTRVFSTAATEEHLPMKSARQVFEQFQKCYLVLKENRSWCVSVSPGLRDETWSLSTGVRCMVDMGYVQDPGVLSDLGTQSVP